MEYVTSFGLFSQGGIAYSYRRFCFSRAVSAAMCLSLNKGTAAMLVPSVNPPIIELYPYSKGFFFFFVEKHAH